MPQNEMPSLTEDEKKTLSVLAFLFFRLGMEERARRFYETIAELSAPGTPDFRFAKAGLAAAALEAGDAETAVAAAGSVDVVTVAFGVRNFGDLGRGLAELSRALRPGGRIVILEFSTPTMPVFGRLYDWYSHRVLPRIGGWLSHDRQAYDYLPRSVDEFPQPEEFLTILAAAGFRDCRARSQSFGIAQIYTAEKC